MKTDCVHKMESKNIKSFLLCYIDCLKLIGYNFCNITQLTIDIISNKCNITYEQ